MAGILKHKAQLVTFLNQNLELKKPLIIQGEFCYWLQYGNGKYKQIDKALIDKLMQEHISYPVLSYSIDLEKLTKKEVQQQ